MHQNTKHPSNATELCGQRRGHLHSQGRLAFKCYHVDTLYKGLQSLQFHQGTRLRKQNVDYAAFIIKTNSQQ